MWGKPSNVSVEPTHDWVAVLLDRATDGPVGVVGPFASESAAWDWLENYVRNLLKADGGLVYRLTKPEGV